MCVCSGGVCVVCVCSGGGGGGSLCGVCVVGGGLCVVRVCSGGGGGLCVVSGRGQVWRVCRSVWCV